MQRGKGINTRQIRQVGIKISSYVQTHSRLSAHRRAAPADHTLFIVPRTFMYRTIGRRFVPVTIERTPHQVQIICPLCDRTGRSGDDPTYDYRAPQIHGYKLEALAALGSRLLRLPERAAARALGLVRGRP